MDTKIIEERAILALKNTLLSTGLIGQYISDNDREPFFDGSFYIYKKQPLKKENFIARISVQVKGKIMKDLTKKSISFPVSIIDLEGYLKDGGLIYFVVYINSDSNATKIYYNSLTPIKIKQILTDIKDKNLKNKKQKPSKTKNLTFKELPKKNNEIINTFLDFHRDSKRQISFINSDLPTLVELEKSGQKVIINTTFSRYGYSNRAEAFKGVLGREVYTYAKIGNQPSFPLNQITKFCKIEEKRPCSIKIGSKEYYDSCEIIYTETNEQSLKIGECITITYHENDLKIDFQCTPSKRLSNNIHDFDFFLTAIKKRHFYLDNLMFNLDNFTFNNTYIDDIEDRLNYYTDIQKLFDILNITDDIDFTTLTDKEIKDIHDLIQAFVYEKHIERQKKNDSRLLYIKVQEVKILFFELCVAKDSIEYKYIDVFSSVQDLIFLKSKEDLLFPLFSALKKKQYLLASNINAKSMITQYEKFAKTNPKIYEQAILDLLEIISAYDMCKNIKFLKTAKTISIWLLNADNLNIDSYINKINNWQIELRENAFLSENILEEISLLREETKELDFKFAFSVLLKDKSTAKLYFNKMNEDKKKQIYSYPIYTLFEQLN